jgi:hypothetical protein
MINQLALSKHSLAVLFAPAVQITGLVLGAQFVDWSHFTLLWQQLFAVVCH